MCLSLSGGLVCGHQVAGKHPKDMDPELDARLGLTWFVLFGEGVSGAPPQNPWDGQRYRVVNEAAPDRLPYATVCIGWALWSGHEVSYADFDVRVILPTRTLDYPGWDFPDRWVIDPLLEGWSGEMTVMLRHREFGFVLRATAEWDFDRPGWVVDRCGECRDLTCVSEAGIGSVELSIPVGVMRGGREEVRLEYESEEAGNAGAGALVVSGPVGDGGAQVAKDVSGVVRSVQCGRFLARVETASSAVDPERFVVRVSSDWEAAEETVFREVTVEEVEAGEGGERALRMSETVGGRTTVREYTRPAEEVWVLEEGGLRRTTSTRVAEGEDYRKTRWRVEERDAAGEWVTVELRDEAERRYGWGWEVTEQVLDPGGRELRYGWDYYDTDEFSGPNGDVSGQGRLKREWGPEGMVRQYEYLDRDPYLEGYTRVEVVREAFGGTPGGFERRRHVTSDGVELAETVEEFAGGEQVRRMVAVARKDWRIENHYPGAGAAVPLVRRVDYEGSNSWWLVETTTEPDGTIEQVRVEDSWGLKTHLVYRGVANNGPGLPIVTGSEKLTVVDAAGQVVREEEWVVHGGTAWPVSERQVTETDVHRRPVVCEVREGGAAEPQFREEREMGCCGPARERGRDGVPAHFYYDGLGRVRKVHRNGLAIETVHDGLTVRTHRYPEEDATALSGATADNELSYVRRDLTGEVVAEGWRSPRDGSLVEAVRETSYDLGNGIGRREVWRFPAVACDEGTAATVTEEYWLDGSLARRTGPLVRDREWSYGATAEGMTVTGAWLDGAGAAREPVTTQFDWAGRAVRRTFAGDADGDGEADFESFAYDAGGRVREWVDADGVRCLFEYDLEAGTARGAVDRNGNGVIDAGLDEVRVVRHGAGPNAEGVVVGWREWAVVEEDGTERLVGREEAGVDGLQHWSRRYAGGTEATTRVATAFHAGEAGRWDTTTVFADGTARVARHAGGLLESESVTDAAGRVLGTWSYQFDAHRRPVRREEAGGPAVATGYVSPVTDAVASVTTGSRPTRYEYDHRGRRTAVDEPDTVDAAGAPVDNVRRFSYRPDGRVREVTGTPGYRQRFGYDHAGRLETLTTEGTAEAVTRWEYDAQRGWLRARRHDSPAPGEGDGPSYRYSPAGRLLSRTDARGVTTSYARDCAGRVARLDYDDGTPPVVIHERDAQGRPKRVSDGSGERVVTCDAGGRAAEVTHLAGSLLEGWSVARAHDVEGRLEEVTLRFGQEEPHRLTYQYGSDGRLATVRGGELAAHYRYEGAERRPAQLAVVDETRPLLFASRQYDDLHRLRRLSWHNGMIRGAFESWADEEYGRDAYGRVASIRRRDGTEWVYRYNAAGEVAAARRHMAPGSSELVAGHQFSYSYDGLGNRIATGRGGDPGGGGLRPATYAPDALNRYGRIEQAGGVDVTGRAPPEPAVLVNGAPAGRQGEHFHHELQAGNLAGPAWLEVEVARGGRIESGAVLVPPAIAEPRHDANGNLVFDGTHAFAWDAENRLTAIETATAAVAAGAPYERVEYTYDAASRRVERRRYDAPPPAPAAETTRCLHAGWRRLGETGPDGVLQRAYAWGADASGALHLGDPNGALLWIDDRAAGQTHLALTGGRGDVIGLRSARSGLPTAAYRYGPFGEPLAAHGPYAAQNPFRFSI